MTASFRIYIDESGDEGFLFGKGSSNWFVLSAVVTNRDKDLQVIKLVDEIRMELNKPQRTQLHFADLKHEQRLPYIKKISDSDLKVIAVLVHKPSLKRAEEFNKRYSLYFYSAGLLIERIARLCREFSKSGAGGDGSAEILFSNRSNLSYMELRAYLDSYSVGTESKDQNSDRGL